MRIYTIFRIFPILLLLFIAAAGLHAESPRILVMGDSLLATHGATGRAISDRLGAQTGGEVTDRSVVGARIIHALPITAAMGLNISKQYRPGDWDWVVLNGGGNDLWLGCGCTRCDRMMERLISADGSRGRIPKLVTRLRRDGAQVLYLGYLRSPGMDSPIESCKPVGDELEARLAAMAARDEGVTFLSIADLVPEGDRSYHMLDMIHPSAKASAAIGDMIAAAIGAVPGS